MLLRLESHCHYWVPKISKVSCREQMRLSAPFFNHHVWTSLRVLTVKALNDEKGGASTGKELWDLGLEVEVPFEQRPVNEYSSLKDGPLYSWGELSPGAFFLRLGGLWLTAFTILGAPIAAASFNPSREPVRFLLAAGTGTLFLVSLVVLRIYNQGPHFSSTNSMSIDYLSNCLLASKPSQDLCDGIVLPFLSLPNVSKYQQPMSSK